VKETPMMHTRLSLINLPSSMSALLPSLPSTLDLHSRSARSMEANIRQSTRAQFARSVVCARLERMEVA
jgi:hypothetical protein